MMQVPLTLWILWALAGTALVGALALLLARRWSPASILTSQEWKAAFQLVAILVMVLTIIYFQNGRAADIGGFIYGRF